MGHVLAGPSRQGTLLVWRDEFSSGFPPHHIRSQNADAGADGAGYQIAQHYQQRRPGVHVAGLTGIDAIFSGTDTEFVSATDYLNVIRPQVLDAIGQVSDSIDVIVTTKGLPLKIDAGPKPPTSTSYNWRRYSSLESELTRIDAIDTIEEMGDQFIWSGFPGVDPTRFLPQWKMACRIYNADGSHNIQLTWELEVARMNGAVDYS